MKKGDKVYLVIAEHEFRDILLEWAKFNNAEDARKEAQSCNRTYINYKFKVLECTCIGRGKYEQSN